MKILGIMGSHRKNRNTEKALQAFLSAVPEEAEVEVLYLLDQDIKICKACAYCEKEYGTCVIKDDMTHIYEKLKVADGIVLATPVYFNGVSTVMKIMIDRIQMIFACDFAFNSPYIKEGSHKKGYLISVGGAKAYDKQFIGPEITAELVFKDLHAEFSGHYKIANTDRDAIENRDDLMADLCEVGKKFSNNI